MSEKHEDDTDLADEDAGAADAPPVDPAPGADAAAAANRRPGTAVAWLALLVAATALVVAAYSAFTDWRAERTAERRTDPLLDIRSRVANAEETLAGLDAALAELDATDAGIASQLDLLRGGVDDRLERIDSLPSRVANLESSLAALQGISTGARNAWLLAEGEYYMQIANAQLQLANNPRLAALALRMADERVAQVGDPALTDVRAAVADELTALDGMDQVDTEGVTLTLASLARVVDALPLRPIRNDAGPDAEPPDDDASGLDRAWAAVKGVAGGLVKHTAPGEGAMPLVTPDAETFLRTNLTLQLQAARLALLQGEQAVFRQSLDDAADWLELYFDPASTQVSSAVDTLAEIRGIAVTGERPDISQSLRLLRQFRTLNESAQ